MIKDRVQQGESGGEDVYSIKLNDKVLYFKHPIVDVCSLPQVGTDKVYYRAGEHLISAKGPIWLEKPSVNDVFYGEWEMPEYYTGSYIESLNKPHVVEVQEPKLTKGDQDVLKELGIAGE